MNDVLPLSSLPPWLVPTIGGALSALLAFYLGRSLLRGKGDDLPPEEPPVPSRS